MPCTSWVQIPSDGLGSAGEQADTRARTAPKIILTLMRGQIDADRRTGCRDAARIDSKPPQHGDYIERPQQRYLAVTLTNPGEIRAYPS